MYDFWERSNRILDEAGKVGDIHPHVMELLHWTSIWMK